MKKIAVIAFSFLMIVTVFAGCGKENTDFTSLEALMNKDDAAVTELLGDGAPQYTGEEKTSLLAREYELKIFDKTGSSSVIYNADKVSQLAFFFDADEDAFDNVREGVWRLYADYLGSTEGDEGSISQYWLTGDNNGVSITKHKDGSCRLVITAGEPTDEGENE